MGERGQLVDRHYGTNGLGERILAELDSLGVDTGNLTPEILAPFDQLHGRGFPATRELAAMVGIDAQTRVLDCGSGVGGSSRYLAKTFGCTVTGIDLTRDFIDAAKLLTERSGLSDLVSCRLGDTTDLPFEDGGFDLAGCHNVTMNIENMNGFYAEVFRVLAAGGRFVFAEQCQGPAGAPDYPLPWARDAEISFLVTPEETRRGLEGAGFEIVEWVDETATVVQAMDSERAQRAESEPPEGPDRTIVLGADIGTRVSNANRGLAAGKLVALRAVAMKPAYTKER